MNLDSAGWANKRIKKVLIVDDDECFRSLLEHLIESAGFAVITAPNGEGAIAALIEKPDAIILDILMPGCGGVGVLKHLRSLPSPIPKVIAVTSYSGAMHEMRQALSDSLVSQILSKPLDRDAFIDVLYGVLGVALPPARNRKTPSTPSH